MAAMEVTPQIKDIVRQIFGGTLRAFSRGFIPGHDGWDLVAPVGTPVYAVKSGVVKYAKDARIASDQGASGWAMGGGNVVNIDIGKGYQTQYAHLSKFVVKQGQHVSKGQLIGYVGKTGGKNSNRSWGGAGAEFVGSHLHFGVWDTNGTGFGKMVRPETILGNIGDMVPPDAHNTTPGGPLGAWANLITLPIGTILTQANVDMIMAKLFAAGYFKDDSLFGGSATEVRRVLESHIGEPWNKAMQDTLQKESFASAEAAKNPLDALGAIPGAIGDFGNAITKIATYMLAVALIIVGLWLYSKSNSGVTPAIEVP